MAPRIGFIWDFTGKGSGKVFATWAKYIETPLPLDLNVRAGQRHFANRQEPQRFDVECSATPMSSRRIGNLGSTHTPIDPGLKPQDVKEATAVSSMNSQRLDLGVRGIYRYQGQVSKTVHLMTATATSCLTRAARQR
jgi:hypothetical protein